MEDFRQLISDALKQKRPNLSATSLKTYVSILYNVSKNYYTTEIVIAKTETILQLICKTIPYFFEIIFSSSFIKVM